MRLPVADEKLDRVTQINQLMMVMTVHVPCPYRPSLSSHHKENEMGCWTICGSTR